MSPTDGSPSSWLPADADRFLRRVIDNAPLVLWAIDAQGRITLSEGRGLKALGLKPGQVVGQSVFDLYRDYPEIGPAIRRALAGEEFTLRADVGSAAFESRYCPLYDSSGEVTGVLGVSIDITETVRAEIERETMQAQLLEVQKLESLGLLAGGIAHDFNNILTAILSSTSAAQAVLPDDHPSQADLLNVLHSARRAADLTRQMLAYSGRGTFEIRPTDLSALVREILALLQASISKKVEVQLKLDENLPAVEADVAQLQQVLMNLVINGAEALGEAEGTVCITTGRRQVDARQALELQPAQPLQPGEYVFLEVSDTGSGMDARTLARIFDPFFSTKFAGRGLGLAAVMGIVRGHRGVLHVESTVGVGTTFRVLLPASRRPAVEERPASDAFRGSGLVLVVDDDDGVRLAASRLLKHLGFEVIEASDGRAGVEVFAQHADRLALVLLDMTMPHLNGDEALCEMRRVRDDVPVLLTSGYNEVEATQRFTESGLAGFLQKPFALDDLARKLGTILRPGDER